MKTYKIVLLALVVSVVLSISANAGGHRGNGGSQAASAFAPASAPATVRGSGNLGFRSGSGGNHFSGGRMIAPSQRFSSYRTRSMQSALGPYSIRSSKGSSFSQRRFTQGTLNRGNSFAKSGNGHGRNLGANRNNNRTGSIGRGSRGITGVNKHVFARRSANWNRNWNRNWDHHRDHWWHGHRCRFVNGYWYIFDLGFDPWYGYPYNYYAYDYYEPDPYVYDSGDYEGGDVTYGGKNVYDSSDQDADSPMAAAQERLAREGYYRGEIDGVFGPETRRAILRYQRDKGLRSTGDLTDDTLEALGLRGGAPN